MSPKIWDYSSNSGGHPYYIGRKPIGKFAIMGIVETDFELRASDPIDVALPPLPHQRLDRV